MTAIELKSAHVATAVLIGALGLSCGGQPPPPIAEQTPSPASAVHLIYLHGRIIESEGRRPTHPDFGLYEYDEILDAFAAHGFTVHSEVRSTDVRPREYAESVVAQIQQLLESGVPAEKITVVGFSKGGVIAVHTSARLDNDKVNFVFLAACGTWIDGHQGLLPHGRLLSIHEASDETATSCENLFSRTNSPTVHQELKIEIGGGHGAFYRPRNEWMEPLADFALTEN